jgi:hypothetical protein
MVVTVQPVHRGGSVPNDLAADDLSILEGKTSVPVVRLQRFAADLSDLQLFILLDDYQVTFEALNECGVAPVKLRSEVPGLKIEGPSRVYVQ